jgi:Ni,Fe-hydrogenase III small subunit
MIRDVRYNYYFVASPRPAEIPVIFGAMARKLEQPDIEG